jgi:cytochrome c oxidase cbb3-type subunit III
MRSILRNSVLIGSLCAAPAWAQQQRTLPQYDPASRERGKTAFGATCGFCHGQNARGGEGGPDLLHSVIVLQDEGGKDLGEFLQKGRPEKGMPAFTGMPQAQSTDIATFLHAEVLAAMTQRTLQINIVTGDAKAGEAFFNGAGKCSTCHSVTGDLKGIGGKYDAITLQDKAMMPRGGTGFGGPAPGPKQMVTVTLASGETHTGTLERITMFAVTLRDASGTRRTFARDGEMPKVEVKDPLQGHFENLLKITDKQMHDTTAYLVSLQ